MKNMTRAACVIACLTVLLLAVASANNSPLIAVQSTIDSILDTIRDKSLSTPAKKEERRNKIRSLINERFDFEEMAKRSLARHWKKRTPAEKKEFVSLFSQLLESSYIGKIEGYSDEKITYDKEEIKGGGKYGVVSTTIATENVDIPINYKVILRGDTWWVYDITIEGVSFISTYRNQYNKIIGKESYAALVQKMEKKLAEDKAL